MKFKCINKNLSNMHDAGKTVEAVSVQFQAGEAGTPPYGNLNLLMSKEQAKNFDIGEEYTTFD